MADKHSLSYDVRELKLGASFTNNKTSQYHTIKYDFKPASVDVNKMATVDVGTNNQVTVTVPHLDGAGVPQTVFKGSQRPYTKECVLIIDRVTGEITLEKLSSNIQVKKTRQENTVKARPLTPVTAEFTNTTQRSTSRTRVATNKRVNHGTAGPAPSNSQPRVNGSSGAPGSATKQPQSMVRSPPRVKTSPPQAVPWSGGGNSTLASLPMIGLEDTPAPGPRPPERERYVPEAHVRAVDRPSAHERPTAHERPPVHERPTAHERPAVHERPTAHERPPVHERPPAPVNHALPTLPPQPPQQADDSSSSSSSDSDSGSDSDSEDNDSGAHHPLTNGNTIAPALPTDVLNDDLCLSESGSDSD